MLLIATVWGQTVLKIGFLGMGPNTTSGSPHKLPRIGSALLLALDDISENETLLPNQTLSYILRYTDCDQKLALGNLVELYRNENIEAVIGPGCSGTGEALGYLASFWNIPVVSYAGSTGALSDKSVYDTLIRTVSPKGASGQVFSEIFLRFGWTRTCMVLGSAESYLTRTRDGALASLVGINVTVPETIFFNTNYPKTDSRRYASALQDVRRTCRSELLIDHPYN